LELLRDFEVVEGAERGALGPENVEEHMEGEWKYNDSKRLD